MGKFGRYLCLQNIRKLVLKRQKGGDWENANTHNQSGPEPQPKLEILQTLYKDYKNSKNITQIVEILQK